MAKIEKNIVNTPPIETTRVTPGKVNKLVPPSQPPKSSEIVKSSPNTNLKEVIGPSKATTLARGIFGATDPIAVKLAKIGNVPYTGAPIGRGLDNLGEHFDNLQRLSKEEGQLLLHAFQSVVANKSHQIS